MPLNQGAGVRGHDFFPYCPTEQRRRGSERLISYDRRLNTPDCCSHVLPNDGVRLQFGPMRYQVTTDERVCLLP
jgi:hypothetical protein